MLHRQRHKRSNRPWGPVTVTVWPDPTRPAGGSQEKPPGRRQADGSVAVPISLPSARGRPSDAGPRLTASEWRVARAAAGGLSNRQVAARLGLSERTVGNILHRVYRKLRVAGRQYLHERISCLEPPGPLSPREWQVALLISEGLSDKEIAARLGIGVRTVQGAAARVRAKLGFSSRLQILRWVDRTGRPTTRSRAHQRSTTSQALTNLRINTCRG